MGEEWPVGEEMDIIFQYFIRENIVCSFQISDVRRVHAETVKILPRACPRVYLLYAEGQMWSNECNNTNNSPVLVHNIPLFERNPEEARIARA